MRATITAGRQILACPGRSRCLEASAIPSLFRVLLCLTLVTLGSSVHLSAATEVRIKDLAHIYGTEGHKLIGYGLVVGLEGSGDSNRVIFTARALANMLEHFGITVPADALRADNVAAVMVTAELPAEAEVGTKLDVTVSSLGDADSLQGGTLLMTPLLGADGEVYAVAQGPVSIGGFNVSAGGSKTQKNHPLVGRVPNGASVVRPVSSPIAEQQRLTVVLHHPDFTTALRIAEAINAAVGRSIARAVNQACVEIAVPDRWKGNLVPFIAQIESLPVRPDVPARVVINERTGTVVISGNVRILPVAIAHGGLTVQIGTKWQVSQPPPLVQSNYQSSTNVQVQGPAGQSPRSASPGSSNASQPPGAGVNAEQVGGTAAQRGGASSNPPSPPAASGPATKQGATTTAPPSSAPQPGASGAPTNDRGAQDQVKTQAAQPASAKPNGGSQGSAQPAANASSEPGKSPPGTSGTVTPAQRNPGTSSPQPSQRSTTPGPSSSPSPTGTVDTAQLPGVLPAPGGQTVVVPQTTIKVQEKAGRVYAVPEQATLQDLVRALNALGVTPRDLIAIIQALKELGALEGELVIQ